MVKMKDSGIEWIGMVSEDATIIRLKLYSYMKGRIGWQGLKATDFIDEGPYCVTGTDFINGKVNWNSCYHVSEKRYSMDSNIHIKKGDLLMTKDGTIGKLAIIDDLPAKACLNSHLLIIRPLKNKYTNKFLFYVLKSPIFSHYYSLVSSGSTMDSLSQEKTGNFSMPVYSLEKQIRITNLLDDKCSRLDTLINDIAKQIETLEQYKKSVITEAVTKGINHDVKMKDSRIEWIGEIPEHWEVKHIGQIYIERRQKVSDRDYPPLSVTMKGILPQLETAAKSNAHDDRKLVCKGDFAINSRSDRRGSCGISPCDGSISLINTVLIPLGKMNPDFYNWLFHTPIFADEFYKNGHGIVDDLWTTSWQEMKKIAIQIPPLKEQKAIADYLDSKCATIDEIIKKKQQQLETLEEYKKSLIFEYVTGKKEV